jgi:hypothetical protein
MANLSDLRISGINVINYTVYYVDGLYYGATIIKIEQVTVDNRRMYLLIGEGSKILASIETPDVIVKYF